MGKRIGYGFLAFFMGGCSITLLMVVFQLQEDGWASLLGGILVVLVWGAAAVFSALVALGKYDASNIRPFWGALAFICGNMAAAGIGSMTLPDGLSNLLVGIIFALLTYFCARKAGRKDIRKWPKRKAKVSVKTNSHPAASRSPGPSDELAYIDTMDGHAFEHFVADLLRKLGYEHVEVTPGSGDQGVDIIARKNGTRFAIQCKRYSKKLGNKPVQEAYAGKTIYGCNIAVVVTNNYFTEGAKEAARSTGVLLWDRDELRQMIRFSNWKNL